MAAVAEDVRRWEAQTDKILTRLQQGPCSNRELAEMALSYTRRIKDLREAGHDIHLERLGGGLNFYHLIRASA